MEKLVNCIAHESSEGNLLIGERKSALIDCGMAFCAKDTIGKVKNALGARKLDYIVFSHTHYDHIGALPYFKKEWPDLNVVTSSAGAEVLLKDTPRRVIRELSAVAAKANNIVLNDNYDDEVFKADVIVKEGDILDLSGLTLKTIETPGHTRDALSFFAKEIETLMVCETPGVLMPDGSIQPCYLTGFEDTIKSIKKCQEVPFKFLSLPHKGTASSEQTKTYFSKAIAENFACKDFIIEMYKKGYDKEEMLDKYMLRYGSETLFSYQPKEAFLLNANATISCTLREEKLLS